MSGRRELLLFKKSMKLPSLTVYKTAIKEQLKTFKRRFVGVIMLGGEGKEVRDLLQRGKSHED